MPSVFISYASEQAAPAQQLEAELNAKGVNVWRDKTNLHAGDRWPKQLGEAIAEAEAFVLLWSVQASHSDFVELEWNIAVAMKKPIMPCLLDGTTLPPTLKPSHRATSNDLQKAAEQILESLQEEQPSKEIGQQTQLLDTLRMVQPAEPKEVLQHLNTIINQPNWSVGGNVYQAQGDLYLGTTKRGTTKKAESAKLDTYIKLVGLGVACLTLVGLLLDLPTKFMNLMRGNSDSESSGVSQLQRETPKKPKASNSPPKQEVLLKEEVRKNDTKASTPSDSPSKKHQLPKSTIKKLSGIVTDQITGDPVMGATVSIPSLNKQVITRAQGFFSLEAIYQDNEKVLVMVQKDGYETYRTKATPGNTNLGLVLRRKS